MPPAAARAQRFVDLHAGDDLFIMANPPNAGIAMMFERLGYPAFGMSSAAPARSLGRLSTTCGQPVSVESASAAASNASPTWHCASAPSG